jgi:outer membrane protein TolC
MKLASLSRVGRHFRRPVSPYQLTDRFPFTPAHRLSVSEDAVAQAEQQRFDLKAAQAQVEAAAKALAAARAERFPSAGISADYQWIGTTPTQPHGAFSVVGTVNVPLWQGGRLGSDIAQAQAVLAQRQAELEDTGGQIEAEVGSFAGAANRFQRATGPDRQRVHSQSGQIEPCPRFGHASEQLPKPLMPEAQQRLNVP